MNTGVENLLAYQKAFELAMKIFEISKIFPSNERYSLTDQIKRSSRSVCANIAEAYASRRYVAQFISKLTIANMENYETQVWLKFTLHCKYISLSQYEELNEVSERIAKLINFMIQNPSKFAPKSKTND